MVGGQPREGEHQQHHAGAEESQNQDNHSDRRYRAICVASVGSVTRTTPPVVNSSWGSEGNVGLAAGLTNGCGSGICSGAGAWCARRMLWHCPHGLGLPQRGQPALAAKFVRGVERVMAVRALQPAWAVWLVHGIAPPR